MNIPIFDYKLTVIIFDKWEEVNHIFKGNGVPGTTLADLEHGNAIVGISSVKGENSIVHEAEHVKNFLRDYIGYEPQADNDEVDAYLIGYIYKKIREVFDKHDRAAQ